MDNDHLATGPDHEGYKPSTWEMRALGLFSFGAAVSLAWAFSPWLALVLGMECVRGLWNFEMDMSGRQDRMIGADADRWMIGRSFALKNFLLGLISPLAKPIQAARMKPAFPAKNKDWTPAGRCAGMFMLAAMMLLIALVSFEVLLKTIRLLPDLPLLHASLLGFLALFFWFVIQDYRASRKWLFR